MKPIAWIKKDSGADFGIEAINTILKFMEDNRDDIMIIFAGYTKEMEEFLKTNPGLRSRVPNNFIFEDFTGDEIVQLGEMILSKGDYKLEDRDYYARHVKRAYDGSLDKSNGRWIRNLDEQLTKTMADRVVAQVLTILRPSSIATSMLSLTKASIKQEPTRKKMGWLPSTGWLELLR